MHRLTASALLPRGAFFYAPGRTDTIPAFKFLSILESSRENKEQIDAKKYHNSGKVIELMNLDNCQRKNTKNNKGPHKHIDEIDVNSIRYYVMPFQLSDIYLKSGGGNYDIILNYGAQPDVYSARYNLHGYNGIKIGTPELTPILATADGWVKQAGFDEGGFGNRVTLVHNGYLTVYGYLNDFVVSEGDRVVKGQLIGHSGRTGMSDFVSLFFGVAPCTPAGDKTERENGYGGYVDPMGTRCEWMLQNLRTPVVPGQTPEPPVQVTATEYQVLKAQASTAVVVLTSLVGHGLNDYLQAQALPVVDLLHNPGDVRYGEYAKMYVDELIEHADNMANQLDDYAKENGTLAEDGKTLEEIAKETEIVPDVKRSVFAPLTSAIHSFIFKDTTK